MTEHHKFCIGQHCWRNNLEVYLNSEINVLEIFHYFSYKSQRHSLLWTLFDEAETHHCNEVEDSWFGRQRKYLVLIWFKRKRNSALWMFGNLGVWTKYRWWSLIFLSAPFLHCIPHSTAITWPAAEAYFSCTLCQGHTHTAQRLQLQSLLAQVQRCTNHITQWLVSVQKVVLPLLYDLGYREPALLTQASSIELHIWATVQNQEKPEMQDLRC